MTRTERNSLRVLMVGVVIGWVGQLVGAIHHGGVGATPYTWFARAAWLGVTVFVAYRYWTGVRAGISED